MASCRSTLTSLQTPNLRNTVAVVKDESSTNSVRTHIVCLGITLIAAFRDAGVLRRNHKRPDLPVEAGDHMYYMLVENVALVDEGIIPTIASWRALEDAVVELWADIKALEECGYESDYESDSEDEDDDDEEPA